MPVIFIRHIGANLAYVEPIGGAHPDQGLPGQPPGIWGGPPTYPDQGLPGGWPGHVSPPIYHPGHPDHGLPSTPPGVDNTLPGAPGHPDNRPPSRPPSVSTPGSVLVLVRDAAGVWHYHELVPGTPPPRPVPVPPPTGPDQGLPTTPPPVAGTPPVTPAPSPTRR